MNSIPNYTRGFDLGWRVQVINSHHPPLQPPGSRYKVCPGGPWLWGMQRPGDGRPRKPTSDRQDLTVQKVEIYLHG